MPSPELDTLTATVTKTEGVIDSAIVAFQSLAAQIAALKNDPVALQKLSDDLNAKADALAAAVAANP